VRSERLLMEQLDYNLLYRWFVGLGIDDPVWHPAAFTTNGDRLLQGKVAGRFRAAEFQLHYGAQWRLPEGLMPCLDYGVLATWSSSFFDQNEMDANGAVYAQIRAAISGPYRCDPWRSGSERAGFEAEISACAMRAWVRPSISRQPATRSGEASVLTGWPPTRTLGTIVAGVACPPWGQVTVALRWSIGPGMTQVTVRAPRLMSTVGCRQLSLEPGVNSFLNALLVTARGVRQARAL
jgi:hypothetical protein